MIGTVVVDIEGTTSSTGFVHGTLFPYSRARFAGWLAVHRDEPPVAAQLDAVRAMVAEPEADVHRIVWWLQRWVDRDEKVAPLKAIQGWVWEEGFACGDLTSHFFDDVIPALRHWHAIGKQLAVFSSGSVAAQKAWFGHSPEGSLLGLFEQHHFDIDNAGPKRERASYERIAAALHREPASIVFLSDVTAELDAAREAGWQTVGVRRPGDQWFDAGVGDHLAVFSFDELDLSGPRPRLATSGPDEATDDSE